LCTRACTHRSIILPSDQKATRVANVLADYDAEIGEDYDDEVQP
jgi:hypothetical protein